jgi:hypothetical protein
MWDGKENDWSQKRKPRIESSFKFDTPFKEVMDELKKSTDTSFFMEKKTCGSFLSGNKYPFEEKNVPFAIKFSEEQE